MSNKSQKMYKSIIQGLHEAIEITRDRSQYDRIDLDSLMLNDVPLSTEKSFDDIILDETRSDNKE